MSDKSSLTPIDGGKKDDKPEKPGKGKKDDAKAKDAKPEQTAEQPAAAGA